MINYEMSVVFPISSRPLRTFHNAVQFEVSLVALARDGGDQLHILVVRQVGLSVITHSVGLISNYEFMLVLSPILAPAVVGPN